MSKEEVEKSIQIIQKTEEVADQVLSNKHELIELDKRRQHTREAIRLVEKSEEHKVWITVGSMLIKMKKDKALELLKNDQKQISTQISMLDSDQRVLVNKHRDLELQAPFSGTSLKPLDRKEMSALKANLPMMWQ